MGCWEPSHRALRRVMPPIVVGARSPLVVEPVADGALAASLE